MQMLLEKIPQMIDIINICRYLTAPCQKDAVVTGGNKQEFAEFCHD